MTLKTIKQDILKQYKGLLNNRYISALNFLFSPCCNISGTGVAVCTDVNTFTLTITLNGALPSFPVPYGIIVNPQTAPIALGTFTAPNIITVTIAFVPDGNTTSTTQDVGVSILYPTSVDGSIGVFHNFIVQDVVFNGNPCN